MLLSGLPTVKGKKKKSFISILNWSILQVQALDLQYLW